MLGNDTAHITCVHHGPTCKNKMVQIRNTPKTNHKHERTCSPVMQMRCPMPDSPSRAHMHTNQTKKQHTNEPKCGSPTQTLAQSNVHGKHKRNETRNVGTLARSTAARQSDEGLKTQDTHVNSPMRHKTRLANDEHFLVHNRSASHASKQCNSQK